MPRKKKTGNEQMSQNANEGTQQKEKGEDKPNSIPVPKTNHVPHKNQKKKRDKKKKNSPQAAENGYSSQPNSLQQRKSNQQEKENTPLHPQNIPAPASTVTKSEENQKGKEKEVVASASEPTEDHLPYKVLAQEVKKLEEEGIFPLKKKSVKFPKAKYFCRLCDYHCDTLEISKKHSTDFRHWFLKETKMFDRMLRTLISPVEVQFEAITDLLEGLATKFGITNKELEQRHKIKEELEDRLKKLVPEATLEVSGSTLSGFALKFSDLDLDVVIPENVNRAAGLLGIKKILETDNKQTYIDMYDDLSNTYPCLSFEHKKTGVRVVTGVASMAARNTNKLLAHYNSLDGRAKKLVTVFKYWATLCHISNQNEGSLSSHCFPLMAVHYLQQTKPPVLPVLHQLVKDENPEAYMSPEEMEPPWKSENEQSLGELWVGMLKYYALDFVTSVHVINIRSVEPVARTEKRWGKKMVIEDPFLLKRNMTHTVSSTPVFEYIASRIKTTYRYFVVPQMEFGFLFQHIQPEPEPLFKPSSGAEKQETESEEQKEPETGEKTTAEIDEEPSLGDETEDLNNLDDEVVEEGMELTENDLKGDLEQKNNELKDDLEITTKMISNTTISLTREEQEAIKALTNGIEPTAMPESLSAALEKTGSEDVKINIRDVTTTLEVVSKDLAMHLLSQLTKKMLHYSFDEVNFTKGKKLPLYCTVCQMNGHTKVTCTEDDLPPLKPLFPLKPIYVDLLTVMFYQLQAECEPRYDEVRQRDYLVGELQNYIKQFFPDAVLKLFGSSANGFGFGNSDLDICLTFDGRSTGEGLDHIKIIEDLSEKLYKFRECRNVMAITTAKVPIVKLTLKRAKLEADLSLYNTLALQNTKLLNTYAAIDRRVKVLGYTMKYFAKLCDIGDASRGSLSSYAYILMVLHFLQRCNPPVIPVLQTLYDPSKPRPELLIDGWNAWFHEDLSTLPIVWKDYGRNQQKVGELWVEMLRYFTETFDWRGHVVTIRQREPLTKLEKLWTSKCIAIEDPFDLGHNLGGGLSRRMNAFILMAFIQGRELFGTSHERIPHGYPNFGTFLFDKRLLTPGIPPNDRGCRWCGFIGHVVKDCPRKQQKRDKQRDKNDPNTDSSPPKNAQAKAQQKGEAKPVPVPAPAPTSTASAVKRGSPPQRTGALSVSPTNSPSTGVTGSTTQPRTSQTPDSKNTKKTTEPKEKEVQSPADEGSDTPTRRNSETKEITPKTLFNMASQFGRGAPVRLPMTALSNDTRPSEKPVSVPPPGFAPLGFPGQTTQAPGSSVPYMMLRGMTQEQSHSPAAGTQSTPNSEGGSLPRRNDSSQWAPKQQPQFMPNLQQQAQLKLKQAHQQLLQRQAQQRMVQPHRQEQEMLKQQMLLQQQQRQMQHPIKPPQTPMPQLPTLHSQTKEIGQPQTTNTSHQLPQTTDSLQAQPQQPSFSQNQSQPSTPFSQNQPQPLASFSQNQPQQSMFSQNHPQPSPYMQNQVQPQNQPQTLPLFSHTQPQPLSTFPQNQPQSLSTFPQTQPQSLSTFPQTESQPSTFPQNQPQLLSTFPQTQPQPLSTFSQNQPQPLSTFPQTQPQPLSTFSQNQPQQSSLFAQNQQTATTTPFLQNQPQQLSTFSQSHLQQLPQFSQPSFSQPQPQPTLTPTQPQPSSFSQNQQPLTSLLQNQSHLSSPFPSQTQPQPYPSLHYSQPQPQPLFQRTVQFPSTPPTPQHQVPSGSMDGTTLISQLMPRRVSGTGDGATNIQQQPGKGPNWSPGMWVPPPPPGIVPSYSRPTQEGSNLLSTVQGQQQQYAQGLSRQTECNVNPNNATSPFPIRNLSEEVSPKHDLPPIWPSLMELSNHQRLSRVFNTDLPSSAPSTSAAETSEGNPSASGFGVQDKPGSLLGN